MLLSSLGTSIANVALPTLAEAFGVASLDAYGGFADGEAIAAALALDYVRATQAGAMPRLSRPAPQGRGCDRGGCRGDAPCVRPVR